jgi:hypothetical protein
MIVSSDGPWSHLLRVEQQVLDKEAQAREEASALVSRARSEAQARRQVRLATELTEGERRFDEASGRLGEARDQTLAAYAADLDRTPVDPRGLRILVHGWLKDGR